MISYYLDEDRTVPEPIATREFPDRTELLLNQNYTDVSLT
jgi:hypothetical protein